jgi:DNA-binding XRE family transcriptional regulator
LFVVSESNIIIKLSLNWPVVIMSEFNMKIFAQRLKNEREKMKAIDSKWTQGYVASLIGVARPTYTAYENGTKQPPMETVNKLADLFHVSTDYLHGKTSNPSPSGKKERPLSEIENLFFYELDKLSEEDKKKALEHVRYLRYLAEQENKK